MSSVFPQTLWWQSDLCLTFPSGERPYKCTHCGKAFNQKVVLQTHMARHTGEKPHLCMFCPASFSQKGNLHSHVQRVHSEVRAQCHTAENEVLIYSTSYTEGNTSLSDEIPYTLCRVLKTTSSTLPATIDVSVLQLAIMTQINLQDENNSCHAAAGGLTVSVLVV